MFIASSAYLTLNLLQFLDVKSTESLYCTLNFPLKFLKEN